MKKILPFIWQLPQEVLGLLLVWLLKAEKKPYGSLRYWEFARKGKFSRFFSGGSFGSKIILPHRHDLDAVVMHEYGHCKQSEMLGPLYLIAVGILSGGFFLLRSALCGS